MRVRGYTFIYPCGEGREVCGCGCAWVILNKVKNLVISVIVSALTLSDPSTALRYAQDDKHSLRSWVYFYLPASWESVFWGVGEIATGKALAMTLRVYFYIPVLWRGGTRGVRVWVRMCHSEQSEESGNQCNSVSVDSFRSFDCATLRSG